MVKVQHDSNGQFKITLPKSLITAKGWKKGDNVQVVLNEKGDLVLVRQ